MSETRFNWGVAFWFFYVVMGLVQFNAAYDGLRYYLDWHWLILAPLSLILSYFPIIGSICGVVGAHLVWRWDILPALLLFFWYVPLYLTFMIASRLPLFAAKAEKESPLMPDLVENTDVRCGVIKNDDICDMTDKKLCPYCNKAIPSLAKACIFCQRWMPESMQVVVDDPKKKNIFLRAFNGELSLPVTFWCFGVLALYSLDAIAYVMFSKPTMPFWYAFIEKYGFMTFKLSIAFLGCFNLFYRIAIMIGIYKSANRYTGKKIWATIAKILMILWIWGTIVHVGDIINIFTGPDPNNEASTPRLPLNSLDSYRDTVRELLN